MVLGLGQGQTQKGQRGLKNHKKIRPGAKMGCHNSGQTDGYDGMDVKFTGFFQNVGGSKK